MPNFGIPDEDEEIFVFDWEHWGMWPNRRFAGVTPARVLWDIKSGCAEKYKMVPAEPPPVID
jgi:hypothetical protein